MSKSSELSIIVPTFNEADNIEKLVSLLSETLSDIAWEVVFVDDNSPDATSSLVRRIAQEDSRVRCIQRYARRGLSSAVIEGILSTSSPYLSIERLPRTSGFLPHGSFPSSRPRSALQEIQFARGH